MRRTLYLSMVCLLSALSVAGQTGLRDLNPIEKQKLQYRNCPVRRHELDASIQWKRGLHERYLYRKRGLVRAPKQFGELSVG